MEYVICVENLKREFASKKGLIKKENKVLKSIGDKFKNLKDKNDEDNKWNKLGKLALELGAGRVRKSDKIDYTVGIKLNKLLL